MKIVYEKSLYHEGHEVFVCCDKCKEPTRFFLGYTTDNVQNQWNKEEHKFCEKCGSFMDWDSLNLSDVENYEEKIFKNGRTYERKKIMEIVDSADDIAQAMYLLGQYIIEEELK